MFGRIAATVVWLVLATMTCSPALTAPPAGVEPGDFQLWTVDQVNEKVGDEGPFVGLRVVGLVTLPPCPRESTWTWAVCWTLYDQKGNIAAVRYEPGGSYTAGDPTTITAMGFLTGFNTLTRTFEDLPPGDYELYAEVFVYTGPTAANTLRSGEVWVTSVTIE